MSVMSKEELIKKVGDLKVLPSVARKILETIRDENFSFNELSEIIEKDQAISARVLKISNSALYGLRQEVNSIQQALLILGLKTIRSLVLSVSTRSLYKKFGMTEQKIWDHSVGAAISAKLISKGLGTEVSEISFIGGLMHDLGKVIMNNETPDVFAEVMMKTYNEGADSITSENEIYGYNHAEIGARISEKWGFPSVLSNIIEDHHLDKITLDKIENPVTAKGVACVNLADNVCKVLGIGYREPSGTITLHKLPSAQFLNMNEEKLTALIEEINETYTKEKSVFD